MEWLYAPAQVWHVAVLGIFLATWLYAINRGLVAIADGVVRIGHKLEPGLFGAEAITQSGASDGHAFSGWSALTVEAINHPPAVAAPATLQASGGQVFQASDLFSASDADHDALTYLFYDPTLGNGHFALNGVVQHDGGGQLFAVTPANLPNLTFVAGQSGSDNLQIGATDGTLFIIIIGNINGSFRKLSRLCRHS